MIYSCAFSTKQCLAVAWRVCLSHRPPLCCATFSALQTHAILIECYNPVVDVWEHVELPANANPRRSFLAACGIE